MLTPPRSRIIATIQCPDQPGLVAAIASTIHHLGGNIVDSDHHTDSDADWFVMRIESVYFSLAELSRQDTLVICDRGTMDASACT